MEIKQESSLTDQLRKHIDGLNVKGLTDMLRALTNQLDKFPLSSRYYSAERKYLISAIDRMYRNYIKEPARTLTPVYPDHCRAYENGRSA